MNAPDARISKRPASTPHPSAPSTRARRNTPKVAVAPHRTLVTREEWQSMVTEAAYYQAEHRGFVPGYELNDWLAAEDQIDAAFTVGDTPTPCGS